MNYRVVIANRAKKVLEAVPSTVATKRLWRIRSGKYRILYQIDDSAKVVTVVGVGHRKDVYR